MKLRDPNGRVQVRASERRKGQQGEMEDNKEEHEARSILGGMAGVC